MIILLVQLKLRVLWLKDFLGLAIDQTVLNESYPLTSYYLWPQTEAWDQIKLELDSKLWVTEPEKIKILNLTTKIINFWPQYRNTESVESISKKFQDISFLDVQN